MRFTLPDRSRARLAGAPCLILAVLLTLLSVAVAHGASGTIDARLGLGWSTSPNEPCDGQEVSLLFHACKCGVDLLSATRDSSGYVHLGLRIDPQQACGTCDPDTQSIALGPLAVGRHEVYFRSELDYVSPPDSTWPGEQPSYDLIQFMVRRLCGPDTGVPYLERVVLGSPGICGGDSIDVFLEGTFDNTCTFLAGVALEGGSATSPPTLRLNYGDQICDFSRPCSLQAVAWTRTLSLPPLPARDAPYALTIEAWRGGYCVTNGSSTFFVGRGDFALQVERCGSEPPAVACDANGDGVFDAQDLGALARCLRPAAADSCADLAAVDCDGDGAFDRDDLTCCARRLREGGAAAAPRLTAASPNPFAAATTLALTLPQAGVVDVGVFDAAGRRVATLFREAGATAGTYPLAWNGRDAGGRPARGGVYFVRVVTGAGSTSRKLLFLPGR